MTHDGRPHVSAGKRALPWLLLLYCGASLLHFVHNAEYVADYPNLPHWITRASIYLAWGAIFTIGLCGYLLFRRERTTLGLILLAIYTALGLDGLCHYGRAPISAHTLAMNLTIWTEVVAATAALAAVLLVAAGRLFTCTSRLLVAPASSVGRSRVSSLERALK